MLKNVDAGSLNKDGQPSSPKVYKSSNRTDTLKQASDGPITASLLKYSREELLYLAKLAE